MVLQKEFEPIFDNYLKNSDWEPVLNFLLDNSNLPGRRANIELAEVFKLLCQQKFSSFKQSIFKLVTHLFSFDERIAPTNNSEEFLAFCATRALGIPELYTYFGDKQLELQASDKRWRIREAIAMAFEELIIEKNEKMVHLFRDWIKKGNLLLHRSIIAGYAHPKILKNSEILNQAFDFHE